MDISIFAYFFLYKVQYLGNRDHKTCYIKLILCSILFYDEATLNYTGNWK